MPHGDRNQGGFHQAAAGVVVIRVDQHPDSHSNSSEDECRAEEFHRAVCGSLVTLNTLSSSCLSWLLLFTSEEPFARIFRHNTGFELFAQEAVIQVAANDYQLVLAFTGPVTVIDREALACQVEHMPAFTFVEPKNAFSPEDGGWQLVVEEVLEFAQGKRSITAEGQRGIPLNG